MGIYPRAKFDRSKCLSKPDKIYAHFIDHQVYPNEIHTFFVNERNPFSKREIGKNLKQITRRVLKINSEKPLDSAPFTVFVVEACIPNDAHLSPSWE